MPTTFDSLFRKWQVANEAAIKAEDLLSTKLLLAGTHGGPSPGQHELDEARALRITADDLMDATLAALKTEMSGAGGR